MSDTQQLLVVEDGVDEALRQLAHISPDATQHSLIPVQTEITVPLAHFGAEAPDAVLHLCGAVVKVTKVDEQGNPALFSVHKGDEKPALAIVRPAKPKSYTHKVEFSDAAVSYGVIVLHRAA